MDSISHFETRTLFQNFYVLSEKFLRGALRVDHDAELDSWAIALGTSLPLSPLTYRCHEGSRPRDLIGTTYPAIVLYSDRIIQILREDNMTGWTTFPVVVYGKDKKRIKGYHGFAVTGRCGSIDWSMGMHCVHPAPSPQGKPYDVWIGMYFDPKSWDGSDIFAPEGTTFMIVTERVKEAFEKAKITNVKFTHLAEYERTAPIPKAIDTAP